MCHYLCNYILTNYLFVSLIGMKQRIKVALSDIRYIKTEIEKILNTSKDVERHENRVSSEQNKITNIQQQSKSPKKKGQEKYNTSPKPSPSKL